MGTDEEAVAALVSDRADAVVTLDVHDRAAWRGEPFEGEFRSMLVCVRRAGTWRLRGWPDHGSCLGDLLTPRARDWHAVAGSGTLVT